MKVGDFMKKVVVIDSDVSLKDAAKLMSKHRIGSLVQVKGDNILGILTERDIVKNIPKINHKMSKVMSKKVLSIDLNEPLDVAAELMAKNKIKRLLVTEKGKLSGIISATDIIANSDCLNEFDFF